MLLRPLQIQLVTTKFIFEKKYCQQAFWLLLRFAVKFPLPNRNNHTRQFHESRSKTFLRNKRPNKHSRLSPAAWQMTESAVFFSFFFRSNAGSAIFYYDSGRPFATEYKQGGPATQHQFVCGASTERVYESRKSTTMKVLVVSTLGILGIWGCSAKVSA